MMDRDTFQAEVERTLLQATRRAWRELVPDWRDREAAATLAAAAAVLLRERPQMTEAELGTALYAGGILRPGTNGDFQVAVPEMPDPMPEMPRSRQ
jgi:hypothetical protein